MGYLMMKVYFSEDDRIEKKPAHEWLIKKAMEMDIEGVTVVRGIAGYGKRNKIHTSKIVSLSEELPLVAEIVEESEKIRRFAGTVRERMKGGLVTVLEIDVM